jgi:hypothetical protein
VDKPQIEFTGYVDEEDLPNLFQSSSVAVMPYSSSTGSSGVAHLASAYGVPIVCADLPDFRQMAQGEDLALDFYEAGNARDLADCLVRFLQDPEKQRAMATQNFSAALRMTMPNIVQKYLRHFELHQRTAALRHVTRFRRLPNWVPWKSLLLRAITRKSLSWLHRPAIPASALKAGNIRRLLNGNGDRSRDLGRGGIPVHDDGVIAGGGILWRGKLDAAARSADEADYGENASGKDLKSALAPHTADKNQASQAEGPSRGSEELIPFPLGQIHSTNGNGGNGKNGSGSAGAGSNGHGRERTAETDGKSGAGERDGIVERS